MILANGGRLVLPLVHRADTFAARARGLLGRPSPGPGEGVLFPGCRCIHTIGMVYAIDLVFLNRQGVIVRIDHCLKPFRLRSCRRADSSLELAGGEARRLDLQLTMRLLWYPR